MNILIITAHPSNCGFTHRIAKAYEQAATAKGNQVEIIDLYNSPRQDFLTFDNIGQDQIDICTFYQDKITWADELVFVHPMWWGSMPAIMKNWLDVNFAGGFSHSYKDGKPYGLLTDKQAKVFRPATFQPFCIGFWQSRLLLLGLLSR